MIRPFTFLCMIGALGSGLYLYQCKHQAQVLDREIARTIKQTEAARERIGMLRAEWTQLNQPDRVSELARAHTTLQTAKPTQFVSAADLAAKLPPPVTTPPPAALQPTDLAPEDVGPAVQAEPAKPIAEAPRVAESRRPDPKAEPKPEPKAEAKTDPKPETKPEAKPVRQAAARPPAPHVARRAAPEPATVTVSVLTPRHDPAPVAPYVQPILAPAASYSAPSYPAASAPAPAAAAPAGSVLGGSRGLPPPVPFAAR